MYKCTECGCEYDTKPDFCDCGNDEFVITVEENAKTAEQSEVKNESAKYIEEQPIQPVKPVQEERPKNFSEQYPLISRFIKSLDPLSLSIFIICIILSCIIICIKPEQKSDVITTKEKQPEVSKNIPNIDTFWNNELPKAVQKTKTEKQEPVIAIKILQPEPKKQVAQTKNSVPKTVQKTTVQAKKTQTKPAITAKTTNTIKPAVTSKPSSTAKTNTTVKTTQPVVQAQTTQAVVQTTVKQPAVIVQTQQIQTSNAQAKQELANYKAMLRNTIGQKVDFTKVIGDGNCTVSFKIDSSGKLINRSFTKQSSNITLNDAVYKAVMSTPTYKAPPEAYKNETLNLNIKFYNGNFEISLQ